MGYCTSQTQESVQSITTILSESNWKYLLDNSDVRKELNPDVIRSVIHTNRAGENKNLRSARKPLMGYCTSQTQESVQSITTILSDSNWKYLLDNSDVHKELNPDVIRSVIHTNRAGDPKLLLDFLLWSEEKVGSLMGLDVLSIIAVALCNSKLYGAGLDVIYRMHNTADSGYDTVVSIDRCYREFDGSDPMVFEMLLTLFREINLIKEIANFFPWESWDDEYVPTLLFCNLLLRELLRDDKTVLFWEVFKKMSEMELTFDVCTYSIVINAYVKFENADGAKRVLLEMGEKGCRPDVVTYNNVIYGLCGAGRVDEAAEMKRSMIEQGLVPDSYTYSTLLNGYCMERRLEDAKLVLSEMFDAGLKPDAVACNSMTHEFIKQCNIEEE